MSILRILLANTVTVRRNKEEKEILNNLQKEETKFDDICCSWLKKYSSMTPNPLQYRIAIKHLKPEDNTRVFLLSPVKKEIKDQYKKEIKKLAEQAFFRNNKV